MTYFSSSVDSPLEFQKRSCPEGLYGSVFSQAWGALWNLVLCFRWRSRASMCMLTCLGTGELRNGSEYTADLYKEAKDKYLGPAHANSHPDLMVTLNLSLLLTRLELAKQGLQKAKGLSKQCSMFSLSLSSKERHSCHFGALTWWLRSALGRPDSKYTDVMAEGPTEFLAKEWSHSWLHPVLSLIWTVSLLAAISRLWL